MVGDVRDEELDDAIDLEVEKVRRTTYRTDFLSRVVLLLDPERVSVGNFPILAATPELRLQDAGSSQAFTSHSGTETGQNMAAHSQRQRILSGVRIEPLQTPHAMLARDGESQGGFVR